MAKLKLQEDEKGEMTNSAYAMVAKDGEIVKFNVECLCEGQVEVWLNRLMSTMRATIRYFVPNPIQIVVLEVKQDRHLNP